MSETLKPCPFCGGEAIMAIAHGGNPYIACAGECSVVLDGETEAEAVAAWNTRHERTCIEKRSGRFWLSSGLPVFECSCCGDTFSEYDANNYCPSCGARVIQEVQ